ncbi:MAG: hypothetical protein M9894_22140 [Planctomycetes bacterium]|nr:hypothetical protein [Planctomycetota bacterium]
MKSDEKPQPPRAPEPESRDDVVVARNRCPFCHDDVPATASDGVVCAACLARHHEACWGEAGRCAACRHGERLRREPTGARAPTSRRGTLLALTLAASAALLLLGGVGTTYWLYARAVRERRAEEARAVEERVRAEAEWAAAERSRREAELRAAHPPPADTSDARFAIAQRVDELRAMNRAGARAAARAERRRAAWKQAAVEVALALGELPAGDDLERARLEGARRKLLVLDPPPSRGPVETVLDEQDEYLMPPRPDHPDHAAILARVRGTSDEAFQGRLHVLTGTREGALAGLAAANRALDLDPTRWLAWLVRGEALTLKGDHAGAAMALHLAEGFSATNPTWALLARADLAGARGDRRAELLACFDALEVGWVPEWGGHLAALLERIARLELELGQTR